MTSWRFEQNILSN